MVAKVSCPEEEFSENPDMSDDPINFGAAGDDPFDKVIGIFKDRFEFGWSFLGGVARNGLVFQRRVGSKLHFGGRLVAKVVAGFGLAANPWTRLYIRLHKQLPFGPWSTCSKGTHPSLVKGLVETCVCFLQPAFAPSPPLGKPGGSCSSNSPGLHNIAQP